MANTQSYDIVAAMQMDEPYKTYKKSILGKVHLTVLDPFSKEPRGIILKGNPRNNDDGCFLEVWSPQEDVFLRRVNKYHFDVGNIIVWEKEREEGPRPYSEYTDEEIEEIVNYQHLKLQSFLNDIDSEAFVMRILDKAREMDKSEKIIRRIEARLAELQSL